ncbi:MAG TPA: hypothetical protein PKO41_04670 [Dokdonella sp.]|uniref:hypothetical protein n=1 Tax=Dokdonella sp. TaxID=2291710 RepID=UPI0025C5B96B|nr:hypothetical protein [Dokdonella sp.]MBX3690782.1 hypothetical protein [Dokdonella sp.]MCW5566635.1 hypothetical protein [Dokdonella sp.]HNR91704.1 hypothetical protein [Dokdonella sp.]
MSPPSLVRLILLGRIRGALFLDERPSLADTIGLALALVAVALVLEMIPWRIFPSRRKRGT